MFDLLNCTANAPEYIVSNVRMTSEEWIVKDGQGSGRSLTWVKSHLGTSLKRARRNTKELSQYGTEPMTSELMGRKFSHSSATFWLALISRNINMSCSFNIHCNVTFPFVSIYPRVVSSVYISSQHLSSSCMLHVLYYHIWIGILTVGAYNNGL
jgi:hypothetical protein